MVKDERTVRYTRLKATRSPAYVLHLHTAVTKKKVRLTEREWRRKRKEAASSDLE